MDRPESFASDPIARALANGEEHGYLRGARDERARIRRELLAAIDEAEQVWEGCREVVETSDIVAALNRICPEEG